MSKTIHLAISTCPNDTFAFHGILTGQVTCPGIEFHIELHDVEELNRDLIAGKYDVAKASFNAALQLSRDVVVFSSGSALGFGVGPLLLANNSQIADQVKRARLEANYPLENEHRVLCPGAHTTASLLYQVLFPGIGHVEQVVFSQIMPELKAGSAQLGVCIHEGRFTWEEMNLALVADLGVLWEEQTRCPLPLGGILGRKNLGEELLTQIQETILRSIQYGHAHRVETIPTMRKYAQEFNDDVLFKHVDLYVNEWTLELGQTGKTALDRLHRLAIESAFLSADQPALTIH